MENTLVHSDRQKHWFRQIISLFREKRQEKRLFLEIVSLLNFLRWY